VIRPLLPSPDRLPFQPFKPYIPPISEGASKMTIAAGFRCKDGVLLCSDMQITEDAGKSYESKIFSINPEADCFLAYAGCVGFIKEFVEELRKVTAHEVGTKLAQVAEAHYRRFHHRYYTQAPKNERAWAYILLTVREGDAIALYGASARQFYLVDERESFGSGKPVVEPFFAPFVFSDLSIGEAANAVIYGLWRAKEFAALVGGKTKILTIDDEKVVTILDEQNNPVMEEPAAHLWRDEEIKDVEDDYRRFDEEMRSLFLNFPNFRPNDLPSQFRSVGIELKKYRADKMDEIFNKRKQNLRLG
jgi:20S proteasome alpha/beta subunit